MKKTLKLMSMLLMMLLFTVPFSSCSDDDEDSNPYAGTTWTYEDIFDDGTLTTRIRFANEMREELSSATPLHLTLTHIQET